ncbi:MAG: S8 family serine peptidase, partial [Anaerolineae bacterium]
PRGGHTIEVDKTEDAFTALVPDAQAVERLQADEDVESVQPLEGDVFRVTVKTPEDRSSVEQRDELMARLRSAPAMVVHHEYRASQQPESVYQITDEIIVKFGPEVDDARIAAILAEAGVVVKKQYEQLQQTYLVQVTDAAGANPLKVANRLGSLPEVEYAEPSLVNRLVQFSFPRDDLFPQQWHLYSKNQVAPDVDRLADASVYEAWQITKGVRNVVVAVLDDGFELSHPDFQGPGKVVHPADFRGGDDRPLPGRTDYHGTPCAGVAIAEENGQGCVGVAPGCAFMPVRIPLSAPDPWFIEIFGYVSQRANVASCSWGMPPGDYPLNSAVRDAVAELAARGGKDGKGLAIVFAAGNYDAPLDSTVDYDIRWLGTDALGQQRLLTISGRILNGFAAHPDTIAVGAFTSLNRKALYSNWGRQITVTAPSNNFDPTTMAGLPGRGITTTDNEYYGEDFTPGKRYTDSFGGTSSATPLVAGVAALVKSANPALTAPEVKAILEQTADKIEDPSVDPLYGHAKGTFQEGASEWFGSGKVNAYRAVLEAVNRLPGGPLLPATAPLGSSSRAAGHAPRSSPARRRDNRNNLR